MRRRARRSTRRIVWWWIAGVAAAASMLILHSGAYASRPATADLWPDVEALLGARRRAEVETPAEDAEILRRRYEALQERRRRIEDGLPRDLSARPAAARPALRGNGVVEPPRMDSGAANPDGMIFLPARDDDASGGGR